jgi:hypothetical protein
MRYARDVTPSNTQMQALLERLVVGTGSPPAHLTPFRLAAAGSAQSLSILASLLIGFGAVVSGGYLELHVTASAPTAAPSPSISPPPPRLSKVSVKALEPERESYTRTPVPQGDSIPKTPTLARATHKKQVDTQKDCSALESATEAGLLHQARDALKSAPNTTLELVREHATCFAESALQEERAALRIEALCRMGRHADAQEAHTAFEARFPNSPYRRRLKTLLE